MAQFILFPFMAQGHLLPFLSLARLLEQRTGHTITIVNTPLNILTLQSILPQESNIRLVSLPFNGPEHGLPPNCESTDTLSYPLIVRLIEAAHTLQPTFDRFISTIVRGEDGRKPICIISDFFFGWTVETAHTHGIFHSVFVTGGAYGSAIDFTIWIHLPHAKTDSDDFQLPGFPETLRIHRSQLSGHLKVADGSDSWSRALAPQMSLSLRSDGLLFNTVEELEKTGLEYFRMMTKRPSWPIGPLSSQKRKMASGISVDDCVSWLNLHSPSSVLFVSFGSQNTISASQMMELAMGLEESGKAFIWVIRPPLGNDINGEFRAEWLPEGFEERVVERKQGLLVRKWAPQLEILSHKSTGAFISHCGWNSILESLSKGVPLMGWPIAAEQFINSKMLEEEVGVCVETVRGNRSDIDKGRVKEVIEMVMGETEKREKMRCKALKIKKMMEDAVREEEGFKGSSVTAMDAFIDTVMLLEQRTGHTITIVNTPLNILTLQSMLPPESSIRLATLPFNGPDHGLPPNCESADTLPNLLFFPRLHKATQTLQPSFDRLISAIAREEDGRQPICIISDYFFGWTVEIARAHGIFHSIFITGGAYGWAICFNVWINLPHSNTDSEDFQLPGFPITLRIHRSQLSRNLKIADGSDSWSRFFQTQMSLSLHSDGFLFNTVEELEKTGLGFFSRMTKGMLWLIGPLRTQGRRRKNSGISADDCVLWLNLHRPSSVMYVCFGSENTISASQMMELAMGLEESGRAFIWVVRPPLGNDINGDFRAEWLPEGFEERVAERKQGLLVRQWASQLEILAHESTAVFLSHCGWNSVLESLSQGIPLMGWPIAADQFYNSKMLEEEVGVCVEIARGNSSEIDQGHVKEVIEMVMEETEKGKKMRRRALEIKAMIEAAIREEEGFKGSSVKAMDAFMDAATRER
ncbi:UDP-glycosyltransferase 92A1 [Cinnamomum micranthum f. kanehirae]|uniref:UDP-glycosyltransferase 92A1 n=1 Tax=Cinnamomum micranthum f. kanehirae TaxID=337451 RepID=A0A443PE03_9MAGN|nr:UDP-glycosyltransferase 92A1 [Cinnamomum micranthum f. kanehirae]